MNEGELTTRLVELGVAIRTHLRTDRLEMMDAACVAEVGGADTIFGLDRHVEPLLISALETWPEHLLPVGVFAEGLPWAPLIVGGAVNAAPKYWLLIDPIDGTRGLMYEKRSAYFLAAAAPGSSALPRLSQCIASVAVELPPPKAGWADVFVWGIDEGVRAERHALTDGFVAPCALVRPSTATGLAEAFGCVVAFFPGGKREAAALAEEIAATAAAHVFDDQYISTGGQMVELMTGRDRFVVDVRPLLSAPTASCCHPYDLAIVPLARAAGIILCAPDGSELDAPFSLDLDVAWCGYANEAIKRIVHPVVARFAATRKQPHQA